MQTSTSPIKTWLEELKQAVVEKWNEAIDKAKEGLTGCLAAPFRFVWNVVRILWDFTWRLFWLITGVGCLTATPIAVIIGAVLFLGTGWLSIPLAIIALPVAMPIAFVLWLIWFGFKKLMKRIFTSNGAAARRDADNIEKARTMKILLGCLLITGICGPLVIITAPIMLIYGIKAIVNAIRESRSAS